MYWEMPFAQDVTVRLHVVAVPSGRKAKKHQADGVCYFGHVPVPAVAGGCETQASPCVVDVAIKAILGGLRYDETRRGACCHHARERFRLLCGYT